MLRRHLLATPAILATGRARAAAPLVVVELFTSQSCSSCPAADALLRELAPRPGVLALSFHVTYWNRLGWRDPFSLPEATERQRRYAATLRDGSVEAGQVYTPQAVVQGAQGLIGSDRRAMAAARTAALRPAWGKPAWVGRPTTKAAKPLPTCPSRRGRPVATSSRAAGSVAGPCTLAMVWRRKGCIGGLD